MREVVVSNVVPDELVIEILKRLPVKSLLRFRCVSKSWYSLITNSNFITAHINHTINNNNNDNSKLILRRRSHTHIDQLCYSLHSDNNDTFDKGAQLPTPFSDFSNRFIVGCCNGLICASKYLGRHITVPTSITLWNPSLKKYFTLPMPSFWSMRPPIISWCVLGFGYKPVSNDYIVVKIMHCVANDGSTVAPPQVELYELNTGLWRAINVVAPPYLMSRNVSSANVKGALHWVASNPNGPGGFRSLIVSFDIVDEVFGEIMLPSSVANEHRENFSVAACGNSLSVFHYYEQEHIRCCCLWVMMEYGVVDSWSKVCTIDLRQGVKAALGFRKNGEVLLATEDRELYSYNFKNGVTRSLGFYGATHSVSDHDLVTCSLFVDAYMESLVLLEQADRVLEVEGKLSD